MQNGLALHDRFSELATNLGYEFNKALASANDQTIDEQNFETLHRAFEKKLDSEKEIVGHQYRKQIDILKQQEDHTMERVTELLHKVQNMNVTLDEQLRLNTDLKQQINIEKTVQMEQMREIKKLFTENQTLKSQLDQQLGLGNFFQQRIEQLSESENTLTMKVKDLTELNNTLQNRL